MPCSSPLSLDSAIATRAAGGRHGRQIYEYNTSAYIYIHCADIIGGLRYGLFVMNHGTLRLGYYSPSLPLSACQADVPQPVPSL